MLSLYYILKFCRKTIMYRLLRSKYVTSSKTNANKVSIFFTAGMRSSGLFCLSFVLVLVYAAPSPPMFGEWYSIRMNETVQNIVSAHTVEWYDYENLWQRFDTSTTNPPPSDPSLPSTLGDIQSTLYRFDLVSKPHIHISC